MQVVRKEREVPLEYLSNAHGSTFTKLCNLDPYSVRYSLGQKGEAYSDAELRLAIAQIDVEKEKFCDRADRLIAMIQDILRGNDC